MMLSERCAKIKLFLMDVDGVLTDAGMYYTEAGDELKKFSTLDGGGLMLLKNVGILTGLITGEDTKIVARRAAKLRVDFVIQGATNKLAMLRKYLVKNRLSLEEVSYIGDDINDISLLKTVGVAATVPGNCLPENVCLDYTTLRAGGSGAVREFCEWLLRQRDQYQQALDAYLLKTS